MNFKKMFFRYKKKSLFISDEAYEEELSPFYLWISTVGANTLHIRIYVQNLYESELPVVQYGAEFTINNKFKQNITVNETIERFSSDITAKEKRDRRFHLVCQIASRSEELCRVRNADIFVSTVCDNVINLDGMKLN